MTREARSIRCPDAVLGWIPWYGEFDEDGESVLDTRQRGAVEAHASECSDCRAELDMIAGAPFEIDVELPDPDRVFQEITARLDAGEAEGQIPEPATPQSTLPSSSVVSIDRGRSLSDDDVRRLTEFVLAGDEEAEAQAAPTVVRGPWARPGVLVAVAAAAVVVFGVVSGAFVSDVNPFASPVVTYESASAPDAALSAGDSPLLIDVVFVDSATASDISQTLRGIGVEIVSGPSSVGRYRLQVSASVARGLEGENLEADVSAITARLTGGPKPLALFAERVLP